MSADMMGDDILDFNFFDAIVLDIDVEDSFFQYASQFVGQKCSFVSVRDYGDGWYSGYADFDPSNTIDAPNSTPLEDIFFMKVQLQRL